MSRADVSEAKRISEAVLRDCCATADEKILQYTTSRKAMNLCGGNGSITLVSLTLPASDKRKQYNARIYMLTEVGRSRKLQPSQGAGEAVLENYDRRGSWLV